MTELWTVSSGHNLGTYEEGRTLSVPLPVDSTVDNVNLISGNLPGGLRLENNFLVGTPFEVQRETTSTFVLRAKKGVVKKDITLKLTIVGEDEPQWTTPEGPLGIGPNGKFYILDSSIVDFKLQVLDPDVTSGGNLEFWIASGDGQLPPGLTLTRDGSIKGIVDPILALEKRANTGFYDTNPLGEFPYDFGVKSSNGYDSFFYDTTFYDFAIPTRSPKKLNRYYEFTVSVSDGTTIAKRKFNIFLVGDDFLRTDNTIMQVGTGLFTADNTYLRNPVWLTPGDLGYRRADNYVTIFLDVYDPTTLSGVISYVLEDTNVDGSISELPPGLTLDAITGEVIGRVPYQPAVTREYNFTVNAIRQIADTDYEVIEFDLWEEDTPILAGTKFVKIKLKIRNVETLQKITRLGNLSQTYSNVTEFSQTENYDILTLAEPLISDNYFIAEAMPAGSNTIRVKDPQTTSVTGVYYDGLVEHNFEGMTLTTIDGQVFGDIQLSGTIATSISAGTKIYYGTAIPKNTHFVLQLTADDFDIASTKKQFTVKMLGEVDSTIAWITPADLGTLRANFTSTLAVSASTTVPNGKLFYSLSSGKLPPGLRLSPDGEIIGKINQFGTPQNPGLTVFDNKTTTFDGGDTTIDRNYKFTILAQDQFGFSAVERQFTLSTVDPDDVLYSNINMRPLLPQSQRNLFRSLIGNPNVFPPSLIYRPNDSKFGVQTDLNMLIYAGIETKEIDNYIGAIGLNHKRKTYRFGEVKTAIAKQPGSNDIVYEVVYVEIIDPSDDKTRTSFEINNKEKIRVNSVELEEIDDKSGLGTGRGGFSINTRSGEKTSFSTNNDVYIYTRNGPVPVSTTGSITVLSSDGSTLLTSVTIEKGISDSYRFRPKGNTIKADSAGIKVSDSNDIRRYISNITNMRERIKGVGLTENEFLPLWMLTQQTLGEGQLGYVTGVPLCYCKPGTSETILLNIKNDGFDFRNIHFDIDRYVIDSTKGNSDEQYLVFANYQYNV